jgi:hypothetical protein
MTIADLKALAEGERDRAVLQLIERYEKVCEAIQLGLDFYGSSTNQWVEKYGPGMTTRELGDKFRDALTLYGPEVPLS